MKLQIDRMIAKFFAGLPNDEQLNFSVAVTVMKVQRKWRARMRTLRVNFCIFMKSMIEASPVHALLRQDLRSLTCSGQGCLNASGMCACQNFASRLMLPCKGRAAFEVAFLANSCLVGMLGISPHFC